VFGTQSQTSVDTDALLEALADDRSAAILQTTAEPRTVEELSDDCDIPLSTTYRQVKRLESAALLEKNTTVDPDGRCAAQYQRTVDKLRVDLLDDDIDVRVLD
jgi:predicted transcriptional regulator